MRGLYTKKGMIFPLKHVTKTETNSFQAAVIVAEMLLNRMNR
jgi:hypothetical protein